MYYRYRALITSVYDGDTVTANIDLGFGIWMQSQKIRLYGINAPELKGATKEQGLLARDFLAELVRGKEVALESIKDRKGKYGRWLARIHVSRNGMMTDVGTLLVAHGLAKEEFFR